MPIIRPSRYVTTGECAISHEHHGESASVVGFVMRVPTGLAVQAA